MQFLGDRVVPGFAGTLFKPKQSCIIKLIGFVTAKFTVVPPTAILYQSEIILT